MEEQQKITFDNPFCNGCPVSSVVDESSRSATQIKDLLKNNEIVDENEWYVLLSNGCLIRKGRSKHESSKYLKGEKQQSILDYYGEVF